MPYTYAVHPDRRLVLLVWEGDVGTFEAEEATRRVMADPVFDPSFALLADLRKATYHAPMPDSRHLAAENAKLGVRPGGAARGRIAIVVGDELSFGSARQYAAFAGGSGVPVEVFRDMEAAREWLRALSPDSRTR